MSKKTIEDLLKQVDKLMQNLDDNRVPCEELIKKVTMKLGTCTYHDYFTNVSVDAVIGAVHHWVTLRKLDKPIAVDGKDTTNLSWVTFEIANRYWWAVDYAQQLIIVQSLPKLLEKVIEQVTQKCIVDPTTILFDPVCAPKVKRYWWEFWIK